MTVWPRSSVPRMDSEGATEKRATLLASKVMWSNMDIPTSAAQSQGSARAGMQDSVTEWLTTINELDAKPETTREPAERLRRNPSSEDDLALGVEASLYGKHGVRTVQEFFRSCRSSPSFSSLTSAVSAQSAPLSVMDVLNLWNDDPEEVLLDLGFGCDEQDISGRIPPRFINHQSRARGINFQVFMEAQQNRLDIENPDVSNRFRQLEVLQQVTTAFSSLLGASTSSASLSQSRDPPPGRDLSAEARERRRRMGMLLRRASKKTLKQTSTTHGPTTSTPQSPEAQQQQSPTSLPDKRTPLKRARQESICLTPLVEEQGSVLDTTEAPLVPLLSQEGALILRVEKDIQSINSSTLPTRKRSPGEARESFEMEEIQSFDEGSIAGSYTGAGCVMRTNSCQSDSSGFLEEPFIPSFTQLPSPGPELMKALSGMSGGSTDSQVTVRGASLDPPSPTHPSSPTSLSLPTCLPWSESPMKRLDTGPTPEMHRDQDTPTVHSITASPALDMTDSALGTSPGLMEKTVTEGDLETGVLCHNPDSTLQDIIQTDTETEHFIVGSEGGVLMVGERNVTDIDTVQADTVSDLGTYSSVSLEDSQKVSEVLCQTEMSSDPLLDSVNDPEVVGQGSETDSDFVFQAQATEDPVLGADFKLSTRHISASPLFLAPSPSPPPSLVSASDLTLASGSTLTQGPSPDPIQTLDPAMTLSQSFSSVPALPSTNSLTQPPAPTSASAPVDIHRGSFRSGRSVSVQMPSSLCSSSALRSCSPLCLLPQTNLKLRRSLFSRKAWSDADASYFTEQGAAVATETASVTPKHIPLPSRTPSISSPNQWLSRDSLGGSGSFRMKSTSLDTGLWQEEEEGVYEDEDEDRRWEGALLNGMSCCSCSCDHHCTCCSQKSPLRQPSAFPFSLDELEGMMRCMRKFRSVLTDIEEQLSEDQASVYSSLSDTDREEVRDILELRKAVKQEAGQLELQLTDLVHHYDDSFKMKMHRLLDEQSHLCTQLKLLPTTSKPAPGPVSTRSVATQCCLLPWLPLTDMSGSHLSSLTTWDLESRPELSDSRSINKEPDHSSTTKPDKLDFVGFLQRLKESLHHSVNTDSLD